MIKSVSQGVPQERVMGPLHNPLHTPAVPTTKVTALGTLTHDTLKDASELRVKENFQVAANKIYKWTTD